MADAKTKASLLDRFVPAGIVDPEQAQPWRYLGAIALIVALAHLLFAVLYLRLGATIGAAMLLGAGVFIGLLPLLGLKTSNKGLVLGLGVLAIMFTLSVLTLSKDHFTLSTLMWFALIPLAAVTAHSVKAMWLSLSASLLFGSACYLLIELDMTIGGFPNNPDTQSQVDYAAWTLFMFVAAAIGHAFSQSQRRRDEERKEIEDLMERTKRMRAIGELAGGVAHEFNNLLTVIRGTAQYLQEDMSGQPEAEEGLADIDRAATRGSEIAKELLTFAQGGENDQSGVANAIESVQACARLLGPILGGQIELHTTVPDSLPEAAVHPRTIEQAIVNMALNSRDAMPKGGDIHIELDAPSISKRDAQRLGLSSSGRWVRIRIRDTGHGMDKKTIARIYEPFFTTKATGTGLGLAVVFGLIEKAGGVINVTSDLGVGTSISMYLPVASRRKKVETITPELGAAGAGTVLLVDDQEPVRKMARRVLERAGYRVVEASDGAEALRCIEAGERFDMLLTDVRMPRLGGAQLAEELRRREIPMPILFMTGFAGSLEEEALLAELGFDILRKPFSPADLLAATAEILGGSAPQAQRRAP